jgi:integrase
VITIMMPCPTGKWCSPVHGQLSLSNALAAKPLAFMLLTATRTSETLEATWDEFDLDQTIWTIPAARMKNRLL